MKFDEKFKSELIRSTNLLTKIRKIQNFPGEMVFFSRKSLESITADKSGINISKILFVYTLLLLLIFLWTILKNQQWDLVQRGMLHRKHIFGYFF